MVVGKTKNMNLPHHLSFESDYGRVKTHSIAVFQQSITIEGIIYLLELLLGKEEATLLCLRLGSFDEEAFRNCLLSKSIVPRCGYSSTNAEVYALLS
jgi:hypothetical protein